jgi:hypothetical protein
VGDGDSDRSDSNHVDNGGADTRHTAYQSPAEAKADAKPAIAERPAANVKVEQPVARESGSATADERDDGMHVRSHVTVLNAQLCIDAREARIAGLAMHASEWRVAAGARTPFYTRLMTDKGTTVEHRWYHGDRVHQVMRLRVSPVPNGGVSDVQQQHDQRRARGTVESGSCARRMERCCAKERFVVR